MSFGDSQKYPEFRNVLGIEVEESENGEKLICWNQWTKDFILNSWTDRSLLEDYLMMRRFKVCGFANGWGCYIYISVNRYGFNMAFIMAFSLGLMF